MDNDVPPAYSASAPPSAPPPLISQPLPPFRPRKSRGWMISTFLLGAVLAVVLFNNFAQVFNGLAGGTTGGQSGRWLEEVRVEDNNSAHKIAIIDVEGIITSQAWDRSGRNMVDLIEDQLKVAAKDNSVKAVILKVDSPGGEVMASDDISRALIEFQDKNRKPVIAAMGGLAASGGYYVSAPCQWIVANELTITGSIGVIMHSLNYRELMDKVGLHPIVFKSGKFKDMLSGTKRIEDIDPQEHQMIKDMVMETYEKFVAVVDEGRKRANGKNQGSGRPLAANWKEMADGRVLTGTQAYESGFVDEKGNFDTAVARAKNIAKISDANLIRYQEPFKFSSLFSLFGKSEAATLKVDLGLDLPKLQVGRLYFLSATVLH
jgi:protease-4